MPPTSSKAFDSFLSSQERALDLIDLQLQLRAAESGGHKCSDDVLRCAVVLSVAGMDAFFTRRFAELLVPFLKKNGANAKLAVMLESAGLNTSVALELAVMDRPFRRIRSLVQRHLSSYTTQRFSAIDELFLALGVKDLSKHAQGLAKKKRLLRSVEILVERRHQIVHEADVAVNGKRNALPVVEIGRRLKDVFLYVKHADALINRAVKI